MKSKPWPVWGLLSLVFTSDASTCASNICRRSNALIISAFCLGQINTSLRLRTCMLLALVLASLVKTRLKARYQPLFGK